VTVTIVETSKVGVIVAMVGKGVMDGMGICDGVEIVLGMEGAVASDDTCIGITGEQAAYQKIMMEMRICLFLPIRKP